MHCCPCLLVCPRPYVMDLGSTNGTYLNVSAVYCTSVLVTVRCIGAVTLWPSSAVFRGHSSPAPVHERTQGTPSSCCLNCSVLYCASCAVQCLLCCIVLPCDVLCCALMCCAVVVVFRGRGLRPSGTTSCWRRTLSSSGTAGERPILSLAGFVPSQAFIGQ